MEIKKDIQLSEFTTIKLGGKAEYFISCKNTEEIIEALEFSRERELPAQIFSGGSNIIFPDGIFRGVVIKVDIKGISGHSSGNDIFVSCGAGEYLSELVNYSILRGYAGIECLSGIPGSAGATPVQNVGAYGQEISGVLEEVSVIDRNDLTVRKFSSAECDFSYRQSRFKNSDRDRFVITDLTLKFTADRQPEIKYKQLQDRLTEDHEFKSADTLQKKLKIISRTVISIRKEKSMVIDSSDINSRSCGSFFMNPVLSKKNFTLFEKKCKQMNREFPFYPNGDEFKIPAAWLIENSGYPKGYRKGGVGISRNHSLALININGTASELISLSDEIRRNVLSKFGIELIPEPVIL
ncbi:MAG: UDP-N-acetylmuramate dehydrogenase [Bacteroidetes bacterium]|nr:UDP-N-acetylmuramate dehydrogenase [Bacteroidota bacterium]